MSKLSFLLSRANFKSLILFLLIGIFFPLFAQADISSGLVGHWKFDEGSGASVTDFSGSGHTGTLISGPSWITGQIWFYCLNLWPWFQR